MGFSYTSLGLCCDFCSNSGSLYNVRKISCPYGYCQAWACCSTCFKAKKHLQSSCTPEKMSHRKYCKSQMLKLRETEENSNICATCGKRENNNYFSCMHSLLGIGFDEKIKKSAESTILVPENEVQIS